MAKIHCGRYIESSFYATRQCKKEDYQCDSCRLQEAEEEISKLEIFINDAFVIHPNLDLDVENYRKNS